MTTTAANPIMSLASRLLDLRDEKDRLAAEAKAVGQEYDAVEGQLVTLLMTSGQRSLTTAENVTLSLRNQVWARPRPGADDDEKQRNRAAVAQALTENGLDFLIKSDFDIRSLSTFIRETQERGEDVPDGLLAVLQVGTETSISIMGRGRSRR